METIKKLNEHFLSCSICTERFKDPGTLECGHTFCRSCLSQYIKTRHNDIRQNSITCPMCKQVWKVPNPRKAPEEWAKQFKPHFLLQGLLDTIADTGDGDEGAAASTSRACFPCQRIGKSAKARSHCQDCDIALCNDCMQMHTTIPGTSHHALSDLQGGSKKIRRQRAMCQEHSCAIEFCCNDCNKAICQKCCIIYHRKCESVVTIESMVSKMKSVIQEKKENLTFAIKELKTCIGTRKSTIDKAAQKKSSVLADIHRVSQKTVALIKEHEKKLLQELDEATDKQNLQQKALMKSQEIDLQMFEQYSVFMDHALESQNQMDLFDLYQMCRSEVVKVGADLERNFHSSSDQITFTEKFYEIICSRNFSLGILEMSKSVVDLSRKPTVHEIIDLKSRDCRKPPNPVDVTVLQIDGVEVVAVADFNNNCLRSFYKTGATKHTSTLRLNDSPQNVIKVSKNQGFVSFKAQNKFLKVELSPDLNIVATVKTEKKYRSLAILNLTSLVAGCEDPPCIDLINYSGKKQRKLRDLSDMTYSAPWFLFVTSKGNILVSDAGAGSVFCLNQTGEVLFNFDLDSQHGPRGICTTSGGDIVVVPFGEPRVILMADGEKFSKNILVSLVHSPNGICINGNKIYVTEFLEGTVKVFHFN